MLDAWMFKLSSTRTWRFSLDVSLEAIIVVFWAYKITGGTYLPKLMTHLFSEETRIFRVHWGPSSLLCPLFLLWALVNGRQCGCATDQRNTTSKTLASLVTNNSFEFRPLIKTPISWCFAKCDRNSTLLCMTRCKLNPKRNPAVNVNTLLEAFPAMTPSALRHRFP